MKNKALIDDELKKGEETKQSLKEEIEILSQEEAPKAKAKAPSKKKTKTYASGTFHNHEYPGQHLEFWYEGTFVSLKTNETIDIPLEIVEHIKRTCKVKLPKIKRTQPDDQEGLMGQKVYTTTYQTQDFVVHKTYEMETP